MAKLLRTTNDARFNNKGDDLTWGELDNNFIEIQDELDALAAIDVSSFEPYNSGTTYTNTSPDYVSYDGNVYECITASVSGVAPDSDPTKWELVSFGAFTHIRNRDTALDEGGATEVTSTQLYDLINNQLISVSAANFESFRAAGTLKKNRWYQITDDTTLQLYVYSMGGSAYSTNAILKVQMPDATVAPTWRPTALENPALNTYRSWGNLAYRHKTGTNTSTPPSSDATNWEGVITSDTTRYKSIYYSAVVKFSGTAFTILQARDPKTGDTYANVDLITKLINPAYAGLTGYPNYATNGAVIDIVNNHGGELVYGNECYGGAGSGIIMSTDSLNRGVIGGNIIQNGSINFDGDNSGQIAFNNIKGAFIYVPDDFTGDISYSNIELPVTRAINLRANATLVEKTINKDGSDVEDTIDMTARTTLELADNGVNDYIGTYLLTSTNGTEDLNKILNIPTHFPVRIVFDIGTSWSIAITDGLGAAADGDIVGDPTTLNGSVLPIVGNGVAAIVVKSAMINGFTIAQILHFQP